MKAVRIGMVGCGFAAELHARSLIRVAGYDARITAVAANSTRRAAFQERYQVPTGYDTYEELLSDPDVDVIDICTPPVLHAGMITQALRAGKHVICEKPLTGFFDVPEVGADGVDRKEMLDAVVAEMAELRGVLEETGLTFCYAENYVYIPSVQKSRELIEATDARILMMRGEEAHSGSHAPHAAAWRHSGGGALIRQGCHPLSALLYLKRAEARSRGVEIAVDSVIADCARITPTLPSDRRGYIDADPIDVEDYATVVLAFSDGTRGVVQAGDFVVGGSRNQIEVFTDHSVYLCPISPNNAMQVYHSEQPEDVYIAEKVGTTSGWQFISLDEMLARGYVGEMQDFVEAIAEGRTPESDFDLAYDSTVAMYAAYLAAHTGERTRV